MRLSTPLLALVIAGCSTHPTDVTGDAIRAHRTVWQSQQLSQYSYDFILTGSLITWAGKAIRIEVAGNTVQSATILETGELIPDPASSFQTIDGLFDRAEAAAKVHNLHLITFDETRGFPTYLAIGGPADATEAITISNLTP